jgi:hypothetical protein
VTAKSGHNAAGFRKPQKSGFSQLETFVTASLFTLKKPSHYDGHKCYHLGRFCDSLKASSPLGISNIELLPKFTSEDVSSLYF